MIKKSMSSIKKELMARKFELEQELSIVGQERFADDQIQDVGDLALSSTMDTVRTSLQNSRLHEYKMVVKSLDMIEKGTYGVCDDCQLPILEKRLKLFPNAARCLACQEQFEEN